MADDEQYWRRPSLERMRFVDQIGGRVCGMALRGDLLAVANHTRITLYGVANPREPVFLGASDTLIDDPNMDYVVGFALGEKTAVVNFRFDFRIFDISNPRQPSIVPRVGDIPDWGYDPSIAAGAGALFIAADEGILAYDENERRLTAPHWGRRYPQASLAAGGHLLYVYRREAIHVLDVSAPATARQLGRATVKVNRNWWGTIAVAGGRLCYPTDDGLAVIDWSDPGRPRPAGTLRMSAPTALAAWGSLVYAAMGRNGLFVIDVADPNRPAIVAQIDNLGQAEVVAATATHLFLYDADRYFTRKTKVLDVRLYDPDPPQPIRLVDVRDPLRPSAPPLATTFQYAHALDVSGDTLYIIDHHNAYAGLRTVALSDPYGPHGWAPLLAPAVALRVRGTLAVVATRSAISTFDCADRLRPRKLGEVRLYAGRVRAMDVDAAGTRAYVLTRRHLHVVSLTRAQQPREIDLLPIAAPGRAILAAEGSLYVAGGNRLLTIPLGRGHLRPAFGSQVGRVRQLGRVGDVLCAATGRGVTFLAAGPTYASYLHRWQDDMEGSPYALATVGAQHVFCIRGDEMVLLNIADPTSPRIVDHWNTQEQKWWVSGAVTAGARIYIAARSLGVLVLEHGLNVPDRNVV